MHRSCAHGLGVSCAIPARFLIDLVGYRRYGHNEGDEPAFTQPLLAKKIAEHPTVRSIWAQTQASLGQIPSERADALVKACFSRLEAAYESLKDESPETTRLPDPAPAVWREGPTRPCRSIGCGLNDALLVTPPGFTFHKKLERARAKRRDVLADPRAKSVDWTTAEELAFATVLADGIPIRFTGEDAERGTFSQRHAVFHDVLTGKQFVPLQEFKGARVIRDPQQCVVGVRRCRLRVRLQRVRGSGPRYLGGAQCGDFVNGAQVMLDQFVTSARAKWGLRTSLVFLLPHGYEGQGPSIPAPGPNGFCSPPRTSTCDLSTA